MQNNKTLYDRCVAGSVEPADSGSAGANAKNTFTDQSDTFSFKYPKTFNVVGGEIGFTQGWRQNAETLGNLFVSVIVPRSFMPKTNFSDATFTVGASSNPDAIANCSKPTNGETHALAPGEHGDANTGKPVVVPINGTNFTKILLSDAAMSNYYDTVSYRTMKDGMCYAVEYTIHSTNAAVYDPAMGIQEFDRKKIETIMQDMVNSFTFIKK